MVTVIAPNAFRFAEIHFTNDITYVQNITMDAAYGFNTPSNVSDMNVFVHYRLIVDRIRDR